MEESNECGEFVRKDDVVRILVLFLLFVFSVCLSVLFYFGVKQVSWLGSAELATSILAFFNILFVIVSSGLLVVLIFAFSYMVRGGEEK